MGKVRLFSIILIGAFCHPGVAIEYVAKEVAEDLAKRFSTARPITRQEIAGFTGQDWRCDMYGMRTRLQVERNVRLYRFSTEGQVWKNLGAQMIQKYTVERGGLVGRSGNLVDQLKVTKDNKLVAQLSLNSTVLAYSVCKRGSIL